MLYAVLRSLPHYPAAAARIQIHPEGPPEAERIETAWYRHTVGPDAAITQNGVSPFVGLGRDLERMALSGVTPKGRHIRVTSLTCGIENRGNQPKFMDSGEGGWGLGLGSRGHLDGDGR